VDGVYIKCELSLLLACPNILLEAATLADSKMGLIILVTLVATFLAQDVSFKFCW